MRSVLLRYVSGPPARVFGTGILMYELKFLMSESLLGQLSIFSEFPHSIRQFTFCIFIFDNRQQIIREVNEHSCFNKSAKVLGRK